MHWTEQELHAQTVHYINAARKGWSDMVNTFWGKPPQGSGPTKPAKPVAPEMTPALFDRLFGGKA